MQPNRLLMSYAALSLSLSLLAGCVSPAVAPTPTEPSAAVAGEAPAPATQPETPAFTSVPATLTGLATFKGQPAAGFALTVYDARTNMPVERKADLGGVSGLAVLDQSLTTDAQGAFKLQVVGLEAGQALRVVATKGQASLEAIVTGDMQSLGAKQRRVLAAEVNLTLSELTTAMSRIARNIVRTTQLLTPEAAARVLTKMVADMDTLSAKLDAQLEQLPTLADELTADDTNSGALNVLIQNAGLLKETTKTVAELVAEIAKQNMDPANRSSAASDPNVAEALSQIEYAGTVLSGSLDRANGTFNLFNSVTGDRIDASTGIGNIADRVTTSRSSTLYIDHDIAYVFNESALRRALTIPYVNTIVLMRNIRLTTGGAVTVDKPVTINGGSGEYTLGDNSVGSLRLNSVASLQNIKVGVNVSIALPSGSDEATFDHVTFQSGAGAEVLSGTGDFSDCTFNQVQGMGLMAIGAITVENCHFNGANPSLPSGVGIHVTNAAPAPTISGCTFTNLFVGIDLGTYIDADAYFSGVSANTFTVPNSSGGIGLRYLSAYSGAIEALLEGQQTSFTGYGSYNKVAATEL